jgi:hypothetical protein
MSKNVRRSGVAIVAAAACVLTGCSKSSKTPSAAPQGAAASSGAGQAAVAAIGTGGTGGTGGAGGITGGIAGALDVSKQCKAIKPADAQALMKSTLSAVVVNPLECDYSGGDMTVSIRLDDPTHKQYTMQASPDPAHTVSGVGDAAFWFEPATGHTTPWLEAYKGSVACEVSPADVDKTTLVYTGQMPIPTVADSDAAAYAQKEGAVCNDVFSAAP